MRLAFAVGLLVLGFVSATPARADFAVIAFNSGYCRVWTDTAFGPHDGRYLWFWSPGAGCTASPLGKQPIWRCIARSPTIAAIIGGESQVLTHLPSVKPRSPLAGATSSLRLAH
jgi:hypothetical protein